MKRQRQIVLGGLLCTILAGCLTLPETFQLLPVGTPFTVSGVARLVDSDPVTVVWVGDNGITYHLFQDPLLDSALFDQVTTPGVRSRLVLSTRTDLEVANQMGTIVEVQTVLEVEE